MGFKIKKKINKINKNSKEIKNRQNAPIPQNKYVASPVNHW